MHCWLRSSLCRTTSHLFYVEKGMIKVQRLVKGKRITVQILRAGDTHGEMDLIGCTYFLLLFLEQDSIR